MKFQTQQRVRIVDDVYNIFLEAGWTISSNVGIIKDVASHKSVVGDFVTNVYVVSFDNILSENGVKHEHMALYEDELEAYDKQN